MDSGYHSDPDALDSPSAVDSRPSHNASDSSAKKGTSWTASGRHVDGQSSDVANGDESADPIQRDSFSAIAIGFALLAGTAAIAWALNASAVLICVIVILMSGCISAFTVLSSRHSQDDAQKRIAKWRRDAVRWEDRWNSLRADSEQAATAISQLTDGVAILSTDGNVLLFNPAARKLLFLSAEDEYVGKPFSEVVRDPRVNALINRARQSRGPCNETIELSGGQPVRPIRIDANPISVVGDGDLLLIIRDETESRRVDEIRREFVANVSHELKTPLAAIKGYAETVELAIQDDPESACHFMKQIFSQCQRLERLVSDMMQLARAQAGTHNMTLSRVKLDDIISEALLACEPIAESKHINLSRGDIQPGSAVIADREATLTIANNLISNAVRYTPEGGNVRIGTEHIRDFCALVVQDDGVGIPKSEQQRIFERFYRVDKTRESTGGGTGIGLSIVKNLTLAQAGEIDLSSRPGKGSTFRVLLPAADVNARSQPDHHNQ